MLRSERADAHLVHVLKYLLPRAVVFTNDLFYGLRRHLQALSGQNSGSLVDVQLSTAISIVSHKLGAHLVNELVHSSELLEFYTTTLEYEGIGLICTIDLPI